MPRSKVDQPTSYGSVTALLAGIVLIVATFLPAIGTSDELRQAVQRDRDLLEHVLARAEGNKGVDAAQIERLVAARRTVTAYPFAPDLDAARAGQIDAVVSDLLGLYDLARRPDARSLEAQDARAFLEAIDGTTANLRPVSFVLLGSTLRDRQLAAQLTDASQQRYTLLMVGVLLVLALAVAGIVFPIFAGMGPVNPIVAGLLGLGGAAALGVLALVAGPIVGSGLAAGVPIEVAEVGIGGWALCLGACGALGGFGLSLTRKTWWIATIALVVGLVALFALGMSLAPNSGGESEDVLHPEPTATRAWAAVQPHLLGHPSR